MSVIAIGAVCLVVAVVFHWLGIFVKVRAILAFIGTCTVTGGLFGHLLTRGVGIVSGLIGGLAGKAFGVALPGVLVIVLGIVFIHDLHPKKGASARTMYIAIALAACLVAGISSIPALNSVPANVRHGVGNVKTIGG
jgi:hypothetical protein